jgi:hypothetical protein
MSSDWGMIHIHTIKLHMQLHVQLNDFLHMSILKANHLMAHGS